VTVLARRAPCDQPIQGVVMNFVGIEAVA
jgi:hypothetical protein